MHGQCSIGSWTIAYASESVVIESCSKILQRLILRIHACLPVFSLQGVFFQHWYVLWYHMTSLQVKIYRSSLQSYGCKYVGQIPLRKIQSRRRNLFEEHLIIGPNLQTVKLYEIVMFDFEWEPMDLKFARSCSHGEPLQKKCCKIIPCGLHFDRN